ncbi:MAG: N-acetyl-gamma-glutamyl-phosphate reductase [Candidatus Anoxymicrobium japonicum]|uniref:N-acetyl-gamma-glutamyl-phosphate reductase n=1 Tax=Candidatus Anoxymicrobium japonicum TaxID=2013648 RepID=A0A2N3G838_9ACTN|nr:MAG: N-acetyl-gamma-glutamyl-phosphate reductase [Candidatus Anoxymicrobium japonicum]
MLKAAVIGASGYAGAELMRILWGHPELEVVHATANKYAGCPVGSLYPSLAMQYPGDFEEYAPDLFNDCDIAFFGLPHGQSMKVVAEAASAGLKVVDLSADFRLSREDYLKWYGIEHESPELLGKAVYGLPELGRETIAFALVVANPGCYPTSALLGLFPLANAGYIKEKNTVIIDAKSGVSGAGRRPTHATHYPRVADSMSPYAVTGHRHAPEISGWLASMAGGAVDVVFTPHLAPMNRGILSTMYVPLEAGSSIEDIRALYYDTYESEPFVHLLAPGSFPETKAVQGTNNCHVALEVSRSGGTLVVMSAIDNLVKGAAGQAVQNANIMLGIEESAGLLAPGLYP